LLRAVVVRVEEDNLNEIKGVIDDIITKIVSKEYRKEAGDGIKFFSGTLEKSICFDHGLDYVYAPPMPPPSHSSKLKKKFTLKNMPMSLTPWKSSQVNNQKTVLSTNDLSFDDTGEIEYVTVPDTLENEWDDFVIRLPEDDKSKKVKFKTISNSLTAITKRSSIQNGSMTINSVGSRSGMGGGGGGDGSSKGKRVSRLSAWGFNSSFQASNVLNNSGMISSVQPANSSSSYHVDDDDFDSDDSDNDATDSEEDAEEQYEDEKDEEYEFRMIRLQEKLKRKRKRRRRKLRKLKDLLFYPTILDPLPGWWTIEKDLIMLQSGVRAVVTRLKVREKEKERKRE
jgi:hypothetical protein